MDSLAHTQKLFKRLDEEITAFIALLPKMAHDPQLASAQLGLMMATAKEIGGKLFRDVEQLKRDFHQKVGLEKIQEDALRIKHEVRQL